MLSWVYTVKQAGLSIYCYKGWPYAIVLHRLVWVGVYCYTDSPGWMFEPSAMLDASNYSYPHSVTPVTITQTGMWGVYYCTDRFGWVYTVTQTGLTECTRDDPKVMRLPSYLRRLIRYITETSYT